MSLSSYNSFIVVCIRETPLFVCVRVALCYMFHRDDIAPTNLLLRAAAPSSVDPDRPCLASRLLPAILSQCGYSCGVSILLQRARRTNISMGKSIHTNKPLVAIAPHESVIAYTTQTLIHHYKLAYHHQHSYYLTPVDTRTTSNTSNTRLANESI